MSRSLMFLSHFTIYTKQQHLQQEFVTRTTITIEKLIVKEFEM